MALTIACPTEIKGGLVQRKLVSGAETL